MGCYPTVDFRAVIRRKRIQQKICFYRVAEVYFKVAVPNPNAHSAKKIRLHQINYLVATTAEHCLGHIETETKRLFRSDCRWH
jgi:hypothetical protein